jgi:agmatine deiminase
MWLGFPSHAALWGRHLGPARQEAAALALALAGPGAETVKLLAAGREALCAARELAGRHQGIEILEAEFGDIWLRDTGPIFTGPDAAAAFRFNGWGRKYQLAGDEAVAAQIARLSAARLDRFDFVLEGGALDHDGRGAVITTRQCLLNPNRNPGWREADAEAALAEALAIRKTIWLDVGLMNDHTDGHVDNLARFVGEGAVVCPMSLGSDDPNAAIYDEAAQILCRSTDASGRRLRVTRVPSPGLVPAEDGGVAPASHMNFLIANEAVIVPSYSKISSALAVEALETLFPDRKVIALPSRALLTGGGSFHCMTQQQPA